MVAAQRGPFFRRGFSPGGFHIWGRVSPGENFIGAGPWPPVFLSDTHCADVSDEFFARVFPFWGGYSPGGCSDHGGYIFTGAIRRGGGL